METEVHLKIVRKIHTEGEKTGSKLKTEQQVITGMGERPQVFCKWVEPSAKIENLIEEAVPFIIQWQLDQC